MMLKENGFFVLLAIFSCSFASEYEIVHPIRLDKHRDRRDLSTKIDDVLHEDSALFGLKTSKGHFNLDVKRSKGFHTNKILLRTFEDGVAQTSQHAPESCYFHGKIADNEKSEVMLSTCNGIRGHLDDGEKAYQIEPIEGREDDGAHKFYEAPKPADGIMKGLSFGHDYIRTENDADESNIEVQVQLPHNDTANYSKLSLIPGVEKQYIKYLTTNKTRYCEMFLVVDNEIYQAYNNDSKEVTERMLNLVHNVDRAYSAINIRIVLVGLEIWTDKNKIDYNVNSGTVLSDFNRYRNKHLVSLVEHDIAHYMSKKGWSGGVIGLAWMNVVCSKSLGTAINWWSFSDIRGSAGVVGHELGHNFDFPHDADMKDCVCLTSRGCFMGGSKSRRVGFTDCNMRRLAKHSWSCINNYPKGPLSQSCGNGIREGDEECDCGSPEMCIRNDPCCQPNQCKLKPSSQCSDAVGQDCCKNCLFKKQGTLCREAQSSCDVAEYCTGDKATCPADLVTKDGTTCSTHATILSGSTSDNSEKTVNLNPSIKARFLRFNPVYKAKQLYCLRLEVLTCTADEDATNQVTPISTRDLYYTSSLCLKPSSNNCSESISTDPHLIFKKQSYGDCNKPNMLFRLEKDGTLRHNCSGKIVCPDASDYLCLKKECPGDKGKYERLANYGLRHKVSGKCVEQYNGWPGWPDGGKVKLRGTKDCDGGSHRTKLHLLEQDCLLPIGMENGKLPDSAFTSSYKIYKHYVAKEARLQSGKGWCPEKTAGNKEYLQVDMGKMKTVSSFKMQGSYGDWTTGLKLFYSDDGIQWKAYKSYDDPDNTSKSLCYSGECISPLNVQCKDLWDPEARTAGSNCWNKLNTEALGYGTCDPASNKSCASEDVYCGQLQCLSKKDAPTHIKYGSKYLKFNASGAICSGASITIPKETSTDEFGNGLGMVADGTKCGDNKICYKRKCQSLSSLKVKECGKFNNLVCAGRGVCDNIGKCHCDRGYDPNTNCSQPLSPIDGSWGSWKSWSACTAACNGGKRHRFRFCDTPISAHGGQDCPGQRIQEEDCHTQTCPEGSSCKDVMLKLKASGLKPVDGVYAVNLDEKTIMNVYCDMTNNGGGWTLVVSSHSNSWTSSAMVRERNINKPALLQDYSILKYADKIKDNYVIGSSTFEFKIEAQDRGRWGGIWQAPSYYRIDSNSSSQSDIVLKKKFDNWQYQSSGLQSVLPFVKGERLTMNFNSDKWGSLTGNRAGYHPAPWIDGKLQEREPEHIWYWIREGDIEMPRSCLQIKLRGFARGQIFNSGKYYLQDKDGNKINALCDMESFGGGWTLMVNKISGSGWTKETLLSRNVNNASKSEEYSILSHSKEIMRMRKEEDNFQYMIEADGDKRFGGIFEGLIDDGLTSCTPSANKPKLLKKFDNWDESDSDFLNTNPYVVDNLGSLLTVSLKPTIKGASGILVSQSQSIYMKKLKENPSFMRLWMREGSSYKSCNQLKTIGQRRGGVYKDGYYNIKSSNGSIRTVYCDMESDPGAWTLLVTSASGGWTQQQVRSRNEDKPSTMKDYSILHIADSIKNMSNNDTFRYKLDAQKFNHWGGIWEAPIKYTFLHESANQVDVKLLTQFDKDKWTYNVWYASINKRMPWLGKKAGILTTSGTSDSWWYGTIISDNLQYQPAPWLYTQLKNPGLIWYWLNEDDCSPDRKKVDGGLTPWSKWTKCSAFCGQGAQSRQRQCTAPKPRCGGAACDGDTKQQQSCTGSCKVSPIKSFDDLYCVLPRAGGCNVSDTTELVWKKGIDKCDLPEAQFIFDKSSGSITHKCSGKPVCPKDGSDGWYNPILISSKCPAMKLKRRFMRTHVGSLNFGSKCIHPSSGAPGENKRLELYSGCFNEKHKLNFYKLARGPVLTKFWSSITVKDWKMSDLTSDVRFPNNPTSEGRLDNFDSPYSIGSDYGLQMISYFVAPESGRYTFQAACDDFCQVFLSNSSLAKDKSMIIDVRGWTSQYQYDRRSDQKSKPINLENGKKYYIEGLLVEKGGGDHLSVAVTLPSGQQSKPLDGYYLVDNAK